MEQQWKQGDRVQIRTGLRAVKRGVVRQIRPDGKVVIDVEGGPTLVRSSRLIEVVAEDASGG